MSKITSKPMTYERLNEVLIALGFVKKVSENFVAYDNPDRKAVVILPITQPGDSVSSWHLLAARKAITEKKVASGKIFELRLNRPASRIVKARNEFPISISSDHNPIVDGNSVSRSTRSKKPKVEVISDPAKKNMSKSK